MSKKKTVLIIEDEKPIARALTTKLKQAGYNTLHASNGNEGLDLFADEKPDLVILDLVMPEVDGFEVLEKVKSKNTPFLIFSNLSQKGDKERVAELGADTYMIKSDVQLSEVIDRVDKFLE